MPKDDLEKFREESLTHLKRIRLEDIAIFDGGLIDENFTIVARPDGEMLLRINEVISVLKDIDPKQYYYPLDQIHLTILGNIDKGVDPDRIIEAMRTILPKYRVIFSLLGLGGSNGSVSIVAYPEFDLSSLRRELREFIESEGERYDTGLPHGEHVGWINIMRYSSKTSQEFLDKLPEMKDIGLGKMFPRTIELYRDTTKIMDQERIELLYSNKC